MLIPTGGSKDRETCKLTHFNTTVAMWRASPSTPWQLPKKFQGLARVRGGGACCRRGRDAPK